jgi:hypothetical protein
MIISPRLPRIKGLFGKLRWKSMVGRYLLMLILGFLLHRGRMSAQQVACAIATDSRHRAGVKRFLERHGERLTWLRHQATRRLLQAGRSRGRFAFIVDSTSVSHQGQHIENTFSSGNRQRRPAKGRRYSHYKRVPRACHLFVFGLLLTPEGTRIPSFRIYYTRDYCRQHGMPHRTQAELAAELIAELQLPDRAEAVVLGDTAFESKQVRAACQARGFHWIMPANPERVLAGVKPRPKIWSLAEQIRHSQFVCIRLPAESGSQAMRRASPWRWQSKKPPTFYVHEERRAIHSVGQTRIVFSTKRRPTPGNALERTETKVLLTNALHLECAELVELYALRWQIELFFKELKGTLGMHQYGFRTMRSIGPWLEACCLAVLYLEWQRLQHLHKPKQKSDCHAWWARQRMHGLALAVGQRIEEAQLRSVHRATATEGGIRRLRRQLRDALALEYRNAV